RSKSAVPTCPRARAASAGSDDRTVNPCARACSTPASQSVDFPIPASPSSTSVAGPRLASSRNAPRELSSSSLPTISVAILLVTMVAGTAGRQARRADLLQRLCKQVLRVDRGTKPDDARPMEHFEAIERNRWRSVRKSHKPHERRETAKPLRSVLARCVSQDTLSKSTTTRGHKTDTSETTRATSRDASYPPRPFQFAGGNASQVIAR